MYLFGGSTGSARNDLCALSARVAGGGVPLSFPSFQHMHWTCFLGRSDNFGHQKQELQEFPLNLSSNTNSKKHIVVSKKTISEGEVVAGGCASSSGYVQSLPKIKAMS